MALDATVIRLKKKPIAEPTEDHFVFDTNFQIPSTLEPNTVLIKSLWISVDPYIRGQLWTMKKNAIIHSPQIAEVIRSNSSNLQVGDIITGAFKWSDYSVIKDNPKNCRVIVKAANVSASMDLSHHMGPMGLIGVTAYQGLFDIGKLKKGENVFVSGAAGVYSPTTETLIRYAQIP